MFKPARLLLAIAAIVITAVPATAQSAEDFVPDLREERVYLLCQDVTATKLHDSSTPAGWSTDAPGTSYTAGGGCGFADSGPSDPETEPLLGEDPTGELVMTGTYTGNLSSLSVHVHAIDGPWTRSELFGMEVLTSVEVDGRQIYSSGGSLELPHVRSSSGASILGQYTITDIGLLDEADLTEHEVVVRVNAYYSDDVYGWVWGATEIDSGVTFNPTSIAGAKVRANG